VSNDDANVDVPLNRSAAKMKLWLPPLPMYNHCGGEGIVPAAGRGDAYPPSL
jgi:hypothetical protein